MPSRVSPLSAGLVTAAIMLLPAPALAAGDYEAYLAPPAACAGADVAATSDADQASAMLCMIDYARATHGVATLARAPMLATSSAAKADEIVRCGDVSHTACGKDADEPFRQAGYITADVRPEVNENLGSASGTEATARTIVRAWLAAEMHRDTLLGAQWHDLGVAVRRVTAPIGLAGTTVWVSHFGSGRGPASGTGSGTTGSAAPGGQGTKPATGGGSTTGSGTADGGAGIVGPAGRPAPGLRLSVTPARVPARRYTRFTFQLSALVAGGRRGIPDVTVYFGGRRARTGADGLATLAVRFVRTGRYRAIVTAGRVRAGATVVVVRRR